MESLSLWYHVRATLQNWRGENMNIVTGERGGVLVSILLIALATLILLISLVAIFGQNYWASLAFFLIGVVTYPVGIRLLNRFSKQT